MKSWTVPEIDVRLAEMMGRLQDDMQSKSRVDRAVPVHGVRPGGGTVPVQCGPRAHFHLWLGYGGGLMNLCFRALWFVSVTGYATTVSAQDVEGFGEVRGIWYAGTDDTAITVVERFRPTLKVPMSERVQMTSTIEMAFQQGWNQQKGIQSILEESDFGPFLDAANCTWPSETNEFLGISGPEDVFRVDRLFVDFYHPKFDLRVGRQALQWGSAQFINPTDPFPELLLMEPWRPRAGVNAALMTIPFGDLHDMNITVATTDTFDALRLAGRLRLNWRNTDVAFVGAYRGDANNGVVGVDIRGTFGVGYWVESALHIEETPWVEVVAGLDYSFPVAEGLVVSGQYYLNSADTSSSGMGALTSVIEVPDCDMDVTAAFGEPVEPTSFGPVLRGTHYGLLSAGLNVMPELAFQLAWLQNFGDGSAFGLTTVSVRPTGWLDVSLSLQLPVQSWGDGGEFAPADEDLRIEQTIVEGADPLVADFSGIVPDATVILWTRANF